MVRIFTPRKLANATFSLPAESQVLTGTPMVVGMEGEEEKRILCKFHP